MFDIDDKVGNWTIIGHKISGKKNAYWPCRCFCGTEKLVRSDYLRKRTSKSRYKCHNNTPLERFYSYINKTDYCWIWIGKTISNGYGKLWVDGKTISAHRFSYFNLCGPITDDQWVLHRCDNTMCVNPDHLFLGTTQDNTEDMVKKQRQAKGSRIKQAKLDEQKVKQILIALANGQSQLSLAKENNVSQNLIHQIHHRRIWKHISLEM